MDIRLVSSNIIILKCLIGCMNWIIIIKDLGLYVFGVFISCVRFGLEVFFEKEFEWIVRIYKIIL